MKKIFYTLLISLFSYYSTNAQLSFKAPVNYNVGTNPYSVAIGDINIDGKLDLVVANWYSGTVSVLTNTGNGSFGSATNYYVGFEPYYVALGDFNNDRKRDCLTNCVSGSIYSTA